MEARCSASSNTLLKLSRWLVKQAANVSIRRDPAIDSGFPVERSGVRHRR
ncbi:MAG: hypothetical protein JSR66_25395 [Proteobacteria bacterium]|nr:hypothetical protein [Pseudomonadota bacterium]